ncbi:TIGR02391 family protein [Planctomycetota bacterium]
MNNKQMSLGELAKEPETLLALEPEELAGFILKDLVVWKNTSGSLNRHNYCASARFLYLHEDVKEAIVEAWVWLEREGCLAPKPGLASGSDMFITRRGKRLVESQDTSAYRRAGFLPKQFLHPVIAQKVWPAFIRGDYDTAVFQAFKQVEVGVRQAGSFDAADIGVNLMRKAFHIDTGPLRDQNAIPAERQALSDLFAGAIGSYKNPHSHRNVAVTDPDEAAEMIVLASHLLKIVDFLSPGHDDQTQT